MACAYSTMRRPLSKRFVKQQQMRLTQRGAHLLLQTRVQVLNDDLAQHFLSMVSRNDAGRACTAQGGGIEVPAPGLFRSPTATTESTCSTNDRPDRRTANPAPLKSRAGRPSIPRETQELIRRMANDNPSWGEERIAHELRVKLGIEVSPRTVSKYVPRRPTGRSRGHLRWSTFLRLHAQGIIACDYLVTITATFRLLYVFVVTEHRSRRLIHCNVTAHPSSAWTLQQLRERLDSKTATNICFTIVTVSLRAILTIRSRNSASRC